MEVIKKDTGDLQATLLVKIQENDYAERVDKELKKARKTANMKGFRPGHVPMNIIKNMFGKEIVAQEVSKMLDEELKKYFEENKIDYIGDLLSSKDEETKFDVEKDKDFQFAFDFGYYPQIEIKLDELTIPEYKITIEDKTIDEEIKNLQKKYGNFVEAEQASEESNIRANFVELNDDQTPKENGIKVEDGLILIKYLTEDAQKQLIGAKKDDKIILDLKKSFKSQTDLAALLKIDKEKLDEINDKFELTITKIEDYKEGELNQEFFDKLFGKDQVKNEEELRQKVKEIIEEQYKAETKIRFRYDLRNALKEAVEMPLPDDFIVRWQMERRKDAKEEDIRKDIESLKEAIKWDRIVSLLAKEHNLEIDNKDLLEASKANIINQLAQMGLSTSMFSDEQLDQFASQELDRMSDQDRYYMIFATMETKVLDGLHDKVKTEEKEITYDELKKIYEEENKKIAETKPADKTEEKETTEEKKDENTEEK